MQGGGGGQLISPVATSNYVLPYWVPKSTSRLYLMPVLFSNHRYTTHDTLDDAEVRSLFWEKAFLHLLSLKAYLVGMYDNALFLAIYS